MSGGQLCGRPCIYIYIHIYVYIYIYVVRRQRVNFITKIARSYQTRPLQYSCQLLGNYLDKSIYVTFLLSKNHSSSYYIVHSEQFQLQEGQEPFVTSVCVCTLHYFNAISMVICGCHVLTQQFCIQNCVICSDIHRTYITVLKEKKWFAVKA